jgi:antitoxin component of MazEF toxin-antitoxin module
MASAIVGRWGKNLAVRLPQEIAEATHLSDGDRVEIETRAGDIVIRRSTISPEARERAKRAMEEIIADSRGRTLGGISIKELIEEGRKR